MECNKTQLLRKAIGKIQADKEIDGTEKSKRIQVNFDCLAKTS